MIGCCRRLTTDMREVNWAAMNQRWRRLAGVRSAVFEYAW